MLMDPPLATDAQRKTCWGYVYIRDDAKDVSAGLHRRKKESRRKGEGEGILANREQVCIRSFSLSLLSIRLSFSIEHASRYLNALYLNFKN